MKRERLVNFCIMLFPGILIGILITFLIGIWNQSGAVMRWGLAIGLGIVIALVLTFLQQKTKSRDQ
ncbi:MAG: hypothetical protein KBG83_02390 [Bacteroidetes bacterium]|nr:hypothetical protein [Bacteroidota bacterium]